MSQCVKASRGPSIWVPRHTLTTTLTPTKLKCTYCAQLTLLLPPGECADADGGGVDDVCLQPLRVRRVVSRLHHIRSIIEIWLESGLPPVLGIEPGVDSIRTEAITYIYNHINPYYMMFC